MAGDKRVKIVLLIEIVGVVVPAAHVGTRRGHSLALTEGFEEAVFVEIEEQRMVLVELVSEGAVEELHVRVTENRELRSDRHRRRGARPCRKRTGREQSGGGNRGGFEELAPALVWHRETSGDR